MSLRCENHLLIARVTVERFQEWVYRTDHPVESLLADEYFLPARSRLATGDVIDAYAVGQTCTQTLRLHVALSGPNSVIVTPFAASHEVARAVINTAPLIATQSHKQTAENGLELCHVQHGSYRIADGNGDTVVGGIRGHVLGAALFGKIRTGKMSIAAARRAVEKESQAAVRHDEQRG